MKKISLIFLIFIVSMNLSSCSRENDSLTQSGLMAMLDSTFYETFTVIVGDDKYVETVDTLSDILMLEQWQQTEKPEYETLLMTIHLSELYEIYLYDDYAMVYDGYALIGQPDTAYYSIPAEVTRNVQTYIDSLTE